MKKLLFILFLLISIQSFAQTDTVNIIVQSRGGPKLAIADVPATLAPYQKIIDADAKYIISIANNATKDSLVYMIGTSRHAIPVVSNIDLSIYYKKTQTDSIANLKQNVIANLSDTSKYAKKGTTLNSYGITDAYPLTGNPSGFATGGGLASGTNTGDETATTIKTKLGITTLSGSNTGDQDLSGLVTKTTTVAGHALSSNIIISASDLTTGTLPHAQLPTLLSSDIPNIVESQVTNLTADLASKIKYTDSSAMLDVYKTAFTSSTFDTTSRALTLTRINGTAQSVVIPRGTSSGVSGIGALSSSRTLNTVTVSGDNGTNTTFSVNSADSATIAHTSDLALKMNYTDTTGKWLTPGTAAITYAAKATTLAGYGITDAWQKYTIAPYVGINSPSGSFSFFSGINAQKVFTGGLLASSVYSDSTKIPTNGIYSMGNILTNGTISKVGGTSSQFLKADGSVDANSYLTTTTATSTYVPKTTTVAGYALSSNITLAKGDVGLSNVDNTTDLLKPISTATQTALNLKANDNAVVHLAGIESITGAKTFTTSLIVTPVANNTISLNGNITILDTTSTNTWGYGAYSNAPSITQYAIRPGAVEGGGAVFSLSTGGAGLHYYDKTKLWDNGVLSTLHAGAGNTVILYQYFGSGSDADYTHNNLRLYPDKTVGLMTVNDASGVFLTRNISTGLVGSRTAAEVLTDIGALGAAANATSASKLATARTIGITGDITYTSPSFDGSANVTGTSTLATVNSNVGTFTNATVTVNAKGLITSVSNGTSSGTGTVTSASVVSANGFAGTVANASTTPAITLSTSITGLLKGNGTAISAATAGTDYLSPTGSGASLTGITESQVTNLTADLGKKIDSTYKETWNLVDPMLSDTVAKKLYLRQNFIDSIRNGSYVTNVFSLFTADGGNASAFTKDLIMDNNKAIWFAGQGNLYQNAILPMNPSGHDGFYLATAGNTGTMRENIVLTPTGVGLDGINVPTAKLEIPASSGSAGDAPLKIHDAPLMTTPEDGAIEKNSGRIYSTQATTRESLAYMSDFQRYPNKDSVAKRNYPDDSTAVVVGNLQLNDFYRTGNVVKIVSTLPVFTGLNYIIDYTSGTNDSTQFFMSFSVANTPFSVNWGDGTTTSYSLYGSNVAPTHKYTSHAIYNPKVVLSVGDAAKITTLWMNNYPYTTKITKVNSLSSLTASTDVELTSCLVDSTTYDYAYPSTLVQLALNNTGIIKFHPTHNLPATVTTLQLQGNNLTTTEVNNTLIYLDGLTFNAGAKTLNITQRGTAPPSGAGITAKTSLTSKGWTITTD